MSCTEITAAQKKKNIYKHTKIGRSKAMEFSHIMRNTKFDLTRKNVNCSNFDFYLFGGLLTLPLNDTNAAYGYKNGAWKQLNSLPQNVHIHNSLFYRNSLYLFGGKGKLTTYKYENNAWNSMAQMKIIRLNHSTSSVLNDKIYVFCGNDTTNIPIEYYDGNIWTETSIVTPIKYGATSMTYNGVIYLFGGHLDAVTISTNVYSFDGTNAPLISGSMPAKSLHTSVIYKNEIYIIGGLINISTITNTVYKWNQTHTGWTLVTPLLQARYGHSALVYDDAIYVFGGNIGTQTTNTIEKYDGTNWTVVPFTLPLSLMYHTTTN